MREEWLAAEANYGYSRNTQKFTGSGSTRIQSNVHEETGELVVTPFSLARLKPYFLAGSGALVIDPTDDAQVFVSGADRQAKAAFLYGGGVDYDLTRHVTLRAEYRGLVYKTPDFNLQGLDADAVIHAAQPAAGIVFRF